MYYILGTPLYQGKGYRLLNEPGRSRRSSTPALLRDRGAHQWLAGDGGRPSRAGCSGGRWPA
ncbi:MAG: hypothetical protein WKF75_01555 [Singulisphaera sp.]